MNLNMNNLSEFDRIIKDKIDSFEYPYEEASWVQFKKKIPGKNHFWGYVAGILMVAVSTVAVLWYFNNDTCRKAHKSDIIVANESNDINNVELNNSNEINPSNKNKTNQINITNSNITNVSEINSGNSSIQTNNNGVIDNKIIPLVNQKTEKPNASFLCDVKSGCSPLAVRFMPAQLSDSMIYSWDFGDGTISTEKKPTHTYTKPGNYNVLLMVKYFKSEAVISNLQQNLIQIYDNPIAQYTITNHDNIFNFTNQSTGYQKCQWLFPDSVANDETASKLFNVNGKYPVRLIVTNKTGCCDTLLKYIEVTIQVPYQMAGAFSPDGDGINDVFGPQVLNNSDFYCEFQVFNKEGKAVFEAKGTPNDVMWDGIDKSNNRPSDPDIYFYNLKIKDKFGNSDLKRGKIYLKR